MTRTTVWCNVHQTHHPIPAKGEYTEPATPKESQIEAKEPEP
jgi:hypothetical protein